VLSSRSGSKVNYTTRGLTRRYRQEWKRRKDSPGENPEKDLGAMLKEKLNEKEGSGGQKYQSVKKMSFDEGGQEYVVGAR